MKYSKEWVSLLAKLVSGHYYELLDEKSMVCFDDGENVVLNEKEYENLKSNPFDMFQNADNITGFNKQCEDFNNNSNII